MEKNSIFIKLAKSLSFSPNSKVAKELKKTKPDALAIAKAALTTKTYRENTEFGAKVDEILADATKKSENSGQKPQEPKKVTGRGGEYR